MIELAAFIFRLRVFENKIFYQLYECIIVFLRFLKLPAPASQNKVFSLAGSVWKFCDGMSPFNQSKIMLGEGCITQLLFLCCLSK